MKQDFSHQQRTHQEIWRKTNISTSEKGFQNKKDYEHIVPRNNWEETLWHEISAELPAYLKAKGVHAHTGTHNLLSSWVVCANLYFLARINQNFCDLMMRFLQIKVSKDICSITGVELEFSFPTGDDLHPKNLLGEKDGNRGSGQTSPDVAFMVNTEKGEGIVLTECKFTEHSFYPCSARRIIDRGDKPANPHPEKCMLEASNTNYLNIPCHQHIWKRRYWDNLTLSQLGIATLKRCPAATAGYQLFRQQSLAEGIANSGRFELVASSVAFDDRNDGLKACMKRTGVTDFQTDWAPLFEGKAIFKTWTHQEWVQFVRDNQKNGEFDEWLEYLEERYQY